MLQIFIVPYFLIRVFGSYPNIRREPTGITWSLAASNCGYNGLESDETVIERSNLPGNHTFWIGIATYNIEADWKELGCYTIHPIDTDIFVPYNFTSCKIICRSKEYLAHKSKENKCVCLRYSIQNVGPSQCESPNSFHVYKVDDMHLQLSCSTGMIHYHFGYPVLVMDRRDCNNPLDWYLCKSSDKLVSSTNANRMSFSEHVLTTKSQNGSSNIPHHNSLVDVFNSVSETTAVTHTETTKKNEEKVHHELNRFPFGALVGGGLSLVVAIALVLFVCKKRSCGIFKALKKEQHDVFSSNVTNDDSGIPADINSVITSNQTYGIANSCESNSNTYATVNKLKKICSSSNANDEIYTDSSYGEYDRLNEVQKRKILNKENLYDSNEGTRNENDPTYNNADFCERKTNNHDSDIDMYSIMSANSGEYTLNLT